MGLANKIMIEFVPTYCVTDSVNDRPGEREKPLLIHKQARSFLLKRKTGKRLVQEAVRFARQSGYKKVILWTIDFLQAARKLYSNEGFVLTETKQSNMWGKVLTEEKWELLLR